MRTDLRKMAEALAQEWLQEWAGYDGRVAERSLADAIEQVARKWGEETAYQAAICTLGGMDDQIAKLEERVAELEGALRWALDYGPESAVDNPLHARELDRARRVLGKGEKDG